MAEDNHEIVEEENREIVHSAYGEASAAEVKEIMEACYEAGTNLCIVGAPGVGKSALVTDWSMKKFNAPPIILIGSQMSPEDVLGLPSRGTGEINGVPVVTTDYGMNTWEKQLLTGERKVLFLDEFSNTPRAVAAALLSMLSSRTFPDGNKIPDDVMIIMAMNDESTAADYNELSAPMRNRIIFVSYLPSHNEVYNGFSGGWYDDETIASWPANEKFWRDRIVGFLKHTQGAYILYMNDIGSGDEQTEDAAWLMADELSSAEHEILTSAWASPRSWENAAKTLGHIKWNPHQVTPIQERILNGAVGRAVTIQLMNYVRNTAQIDPYELIRNPASLDWDVSNDDTRYNELCEIAASVNEAICTCDGQEGRPDPQQALDFYSKVLELHGGPLFMVAITRDENGPRKFFASHTPEGVDSRKWNAQIIKTVIAYSEAGLVPTEA